MPRISPRERRLLDADFAGYADLIRRDLQDFNFDLDADFADYADLLAGLGALGLAGLDVNIRRAKTFDHRAFVRMAGKNFASEPNAIWGEKF